MRAFLVTVKAVVGLYNELFLLIGLNLLWWVTGGIFLGAAVVLAVPLFLAGPGNPWWLAPLVSIPAGPAMAAMAVVARRCAREIHVDRSYYLDGLRQYWRPAIRLSAVGAVVLTLLLLNVLFYSAQPNQYLQLLTILWVYLSVFWMAVQFYAYAILVAMEKPRALIALRTALFATFANPLFSALLMVIAAALTALSTVLAVPLLILWPALMALLGEHAFRLFLQRAGVDPDKDAA